MANPYATDYPHNKTFSISTNPGANYQIKLVDQSGNSVVTFDTGNMNPDFSDIRFCDELDNQLSYWIESKTDSDNAVVWVKLSSASSTKIILNYGKSDATSESSIDNTMEWGDDFEDGAVSSTKWTTAGTITEVSGILTIDGSAYSTLNKIVSKTSFSTSYTAMMKVQYVNGHSVSFGLRLDTTPYDGFDISIPDSTISCRTANESTTTLSTISYSSGYNLYEFKFSGSSAIFSQNGTVLATHTTNLPDEAIPFRAAAYRDTGVATAIPIDIDFVAVRKYIETEPYLTEVSSISADFSADVVTGAVPLTVTFTDSSDNTPISWAWKFGDGEISSSQNPVHIYAAPGTYKVILTATNAGGSDTETKIDYIEVTPSSSTVFVYLKETEMDHKIGSTQKHGFKISAWNGSGFKSTCTAPVISCSVNGADETTETWTISAFSATMNRFTLEVVDPGTWVAGDNIHIQIICDEGFADLFLNVVPNYASLATYTNVSDSEASIIAAIDIDAALTLYGVATSAEITDIKGTGWSDETLVTIQAAAETGGTGTGGNEQVLESTDYTFDASAKTITLLGDYATLELPQILSIKNVTKGLMTIYDCENPLTAITLATSVISWTPDFKYKDQAFEGTDELQIRVNKK